MHMIHWKGLMKNTTSGVIKDLNWKKQRYNSSQKPLSRFILFFDAIWATAVEVAILRKDTSHGKDGRCPSTDAMFFLEHCSEERVLQAAMMADAAEENLHIVRFFDNPGSRGYDLTYIARELHKYLNTIDYLFVCNGDVSDAGCLKCGGYTAYIIEVMLKRPRVAVLTKQRTFSIGGPGTVRTAMVSRCLTRMASWVRLAALCVDVEFPGWKCIMAFTVFDVTRDRQMSTGFPAEFTQECWQRLGTIFKVPHKQLEAEANALIPEVRHEFQVANEQQTSAAPASKRTDMSWAEAWGRTTKKKLDRCPERVKCVLPVVARLQAADGIGSCVCEHGFSRIKHVQACTTALG